MTAPRLEKLRHFIYEVDRLRHEHHQTAPLLDAVAQRLAALVCYDDWLPEEYTLSHPHHYQQYLSHADSGERSSVVSFVQGPGQVTLIHDHWVWGAISMLRGAEENQRYRLDVDDIPRVLGAATLLEAGQVEKASADNGDIHHVSNTSADRVSVNIHIYGDNIGVVKRAVYTLGGQQKPSISGYFNRHLPNIWDLSREHRG